MPYKDPIKQKAAVRQSTIRNREIRRQRQQQKRAELRAWIADLKRGPCTDCGNTFHPAAMDFDHLPGTTKIAGIREMVNRFQSRRMIEEEIAKCELVCANCHRIRSFERGQQFSSCMV